MSRPASAKLGARRTSPLRSARLRSWSRRRALTCAPAARWSGSRWTARAWRRELRVVRKELAKVQGEYAEGEQASHFEWLASWHQKLLAAMGAPNAGDGFPDFTGFKKLALRATQDVVEAKAEALDQARAVRLQQRTQRLQDEVAARRKELAEIQACRRASAEELKRSRRAREKVKPPEGPSTSTTSASTAQRVAELKLRHGGAAAHCADLRRQLKELRAAARPMFSHVYKIRMERLKAELAQQKQHQLQEAEEAMLREETRQRAAMDAQLAARRRKLQELRAAATQEASREAKDRKMQVDAPDAGDNTFPPSIPEQMSLEKQEAKEVQGMQRAEAAATSDAADEADAEDADNAAGTDKDKEEETGERAARPEDEDEAVHEKDVAARSTGEHVQSAEAADMVAFSLAEHVTGMKVDAPDAGDNTLPPSIPEQLSLEKQEAKEVQGMQRAEAAATSDAADAADAEDADNAAGTDKDKEEETGERAARPKDEDEAVHEKDVAARSTGEHVQSAEAADMVAFSLAEHVTGMRVDAPDAGDNTFPPSIPEQLSLEKQEAKEVQGMQRAEAAATSDAADAADAEDADDAAGTDKDKEEETGGRAARPKDEDEAVHEEDVAARSTGEHVQSAEAADMVAFSLAEHVTGMKVDAPDAGDNTLPPSIPEQLSLEKQEAKEVQGMQRAEAAATSDAADEADAEDADNAAGTDKRKEEETGERAAKPKDEEEAVHEEDVAARSTGEHVQSAEAADMVAFSRAEHATGMKVDAGDNTFPPSIPEQLSLEKQEAKEVQGMQRAEAAATSDAADAADAEDADDAAGTDKDKEEETGERAARPKDEDEAVHEKDVAARSTGEHVQSAEAADMVAYGLAEHATGMKVDAPDAGDNTFPPSIPEQLSLEKQEAKEVQGMQRAEAAATSDAADAADAEDADDAAGTDKDKEEETGGRAARPKDEDEAVHEEDVAARTSEENVQSAEAAEMVAFSLAEHVTGIKLADISSASLPQKPADMSQELPAARLQDQPADMADDESVASMQDRPADMANDMSGASLHETPADVADDHLITSIPEKPADMADDESIASQQDKLAVMTEDRPAAQVQHQPADMTDDQSIASLQEKPSDMDEDESVTSMQEKLSDMAEDESVVSTTEKPADMNEDQSAASFQRPADMAEAQSGPSSARQHPSTLPKRVMRYRDSSSSEESEMESPADQSAGKPPDAEKEEPPDATGAESVGIRAKNPNPEVKHLKVARMDARAEDAELPEFLSATWQDVEGSLVLSESASPARRKGVLADSEDLDVQNNPKPRKP
ncbi:unnamed protein product [Effrenium voratum]|uniref:Uncharacterized protein n=1 Tax=Effrenium voratum TaxID=2562239 RepID=A0AA36I468_9DINO|nr:unnamed protein product [Effrenium voratum]